MPLARCEFLAFSSGPNPERTDFWIRVHRPAMACRFEITLPDGAASDIPAAHAALDAVDAIEDALSVYRESSEVSAVSRAASPATRPLRRRPA
jgi:thiamine biosynthesis lipoprotein ApbE